MIASSGSESRVSQGGRLKMPAEAAEESYSSEHSPQNAQAHFRIQRAAT